MTTMRKLILPLALAAACPLALADAAAPFVGKWSAQWQTDRQTYDAEFEVTPTGGWWKTATSSRKNVCAGRQVPLQHDEAAADKLDVTLRFDEVIQGCSNVRVKLKLDDKGNVVGTRSGYELQLKRQ